MYTFTVYAYCIYTSYERIVPSPDTECEVIPSVTSLRARVFEALRRAIIQGILPPDSTIVEQQVADELEVSRTPVREALQKLEGLGLVQRSDGRRRYVVRGFTAKDVDDIASVRILLEESAILESTPLLGPGDFVHLNRLLEEMEQSVMDPGSRGLHSRAHRQFHLYMAERSDNLYLQKLVTSVLDYATMVWEAYQPSRGHLVLAQKSHRGIVEALQNGECREAQQILRQHIERSLNRTKQIIQKQETRRSVRDLF